MSTDQSTKPVEYREIERFPGCRFGDDGSIWSRRNRGNSGGLCNIWKLLTPTSTRDGYLKVKLTIGACEQYTGRVHRLILEAFVGPCPAGYEACHEDGNRKNNQIANLRWDTKQGNMVDRNRHGNTLHGTRNHQTKLRDADILAIRQLCQDGKTQREIARMFGICQATVKNIHRGYYWRHVPSK